MEMEADFAAAEAVVDEAYPTPLHRLLAELEAVTEEQIAARKPMEAVARDEKVIGSVSIDLRRLKALHAYKVDQHAALVDEHRAMHDRMEEEETEERSPEHLALHRDIKRVANDAEVLRSLFWGSIQEEFPGDPEASGMGLRDGWLVVDRFGIGSEQGFRFMLAALASGIFRL